MSWHSLISAYEGYMLDVVGEFLKLNEVPAGSPVGQHGPLECFQAFLVGLVLERWTHLRRSALDSLQKITIAA